MFAFFMTLATTAALAQQCHLLIDWRNIKIRQHYVRVHRRGNPELNIAGANFGVDLVLFYIRALCPPQVSRLLSQTNRALRILLLHRRRHVGCLLVSHISVLEKPFGFMI